MRVDVRDLELRLERYFELGLVSGSGRGATLMGQSHDITKEEGRTGLVEFIVKVVSEMQEWEVEQSHRVAEIKKVVSSIKTKNV